MSTIYNNAFYDLQSKESYESALVVLALLRQKLGEKIILDSIIDFGCGVGSWLAAAKEVGFNDICGTDGDYVPEDRLLIRRDEFFSNDLSKPNTIEAPEKKFDLAISLEVAEHLPSSSAAAFVNKLTSTSDIILFSAALPYQGGHGHVNENWLEYWINLFERAGFELLDILRSDLWHNPNVAWWYKQNAVVFVNKKVANTIDLKSGFGKSIVHPEQFLTAIHRDKVIVRNNLKQDVSYFSKIKTSEDVISYGKEVSYVAKSTRADELEKQKNDFSSLSSIESLRINEQNIARQFFEKRVSLPDIFFLGSVRQFSAVISAVSQNDGVWLPPTKFSGFFEEYFFLEKNEFFKKCRRHRGFELLKSTLLNNEIINDKWLNLLTFMTTESVDPHWYSELFYRPKMKKKTCDFSICLFFLPEELLRAFGLDKSTIKVFFHQFTVEELEFLREKNFFSGSGISLNEVIERNCAKWKRIVGNDNFIIYKDVGELKNHHELSR